MLITYESLIATRVILSGADSKIKLPWKSSLIQKLNFINWVLPSLYKSDSGDNTQLIHDTFWEYMGDTVKNIQTVEYQHVIYPFNSMLFKLGKILGERKLQKIFDNNPIRISYKRNDITTIIYGKFIIPNEINDKGYSVKYISDFDIESYREIMVDSIIDMCNPEDNIK